LCIGYSMCNGGRCYLLTFLGTDVADGTDFGLNRKGTKGAKFFGFFRIGVKPIRKRQRLGGVAANSDCLPFCEP